MRAPLPLALAVAALVAGCGASESLLRARQTLDVTARALDETRREARAGTEPGSPERERVVDAYRAARRRERDAIEAAGLWEDQSAGSLAWRVFAPCLAVALEDLREAVEAAGLEAPRTVDEAIALAVVSAGEGWCLEREAVPRVPAPPLPEPPGH